MTGTYTENKQKTSNMKIRIILVLMYFLSNSFILKSQEITPPDHTFQQAYNYIDGMLKDDIPLNFKDAVFSTEAAYFGGTLNLEVLNKKSSLLLSLIKNISNPELINYPGEDAEAATKYLYVFNILIHKYLILVTHACMNPRSIIQYLDLQV